MVDRFFSERSGHAVVARAESVDLDRALWDATAELGLPLVGVDEGAGGSGGSTLDALTVHRLAAYHALPLPLAETYLATWALAEAGREVPDGPLAFAVADSHFRADSDRAEGVLRRVPWARAASGLVVLSPSGDATKVTLVPATSLLAARGTDLAGQPSGDVTVDGPADSVDTDAGLSAALSRRAALVRAAQIVGGVQAIRDLTSAYVAQREQFGKPIGSFQSVQQHIVALAQAAAMTSLVVDQATMALGTSREVFEVAAAKLVADQHAVLAARAAHAAHGAIGMTQEYRLQQLTRRLHVARLVDGRERELAGRIGRAAGAATSVHAIITGVDKEPLS